jgi:hypothetical protein
MIDLAHIVEATRRQVDLLDDLSKFGEAGKMPERRLVGLKEAGEADAATDIQNMIAAVADRIRQVGFQIAFRGIQPCKRFRVRIETREAADPTPQHLFVGRIAVDRIRADIDDAGEAARLEEIDKWFVCGLCWNIRLRRGDTCSPQPIRKVM